jgi:endoglucanase
LTKFCEQNEFIAKNEDVIVGFVGWGAGGFDDTYVLTLTPLKSGNTWTDNKLMKQCIIGAFGKALDPIVPPTSSTTSTPPTTEPATQSSTEAPPVATKDTNANQAPSNKGNGAGQVTISSLAIALAGMAWLCLHSD